MALVKINDHQYFLLNTYGRDDDNAIFFNISSNKITQTQGKYRGGLQCSSRYDID